MKYAQFKDQKLNYVMIVGRDEADLERPYCDDVRISEWIDVEFPPLPWQKAYPASDGYRCAKCGKVKLAWLDSQLSEADLRGL